MFTSTQRATTKKSGKQVVTSTVSPVDLNNEDEVKSMLYQWSVALGAMGQSVRVLFKSLEQLYCTSVWELFIGRTPVRKNEVRRSTKLASSLLISRFPHFCLNKSSNRIQFSFTARCEMVWTTNSFPKDDSRARASSTHVALYRTDTFSCRLSKSTHIDVSLSATIVSRCQEREQWSLPFSLDPFLITTDERERIEERKNVYPSSK